MDGTLDRCSSQILDALLDVRGPGLVHGDLVPGAVLVTEDKRPGVTDLRSLTAYGEPDLDVASTPIGQFRRLTADRVDTLPEGPLHEVDRGLRRVLAL